MKFVEDWQSGWRWVSMQCFAAISALGFAMAMLPADYRTALVMKIYTWLNVALALIGAFGRNVQQVPNAPPASVTEPVPAAVAPPPGGLVLVSNNPEKP